MRPKDMEDAEYEIFDLQQKLEKCEKQNANMLQFLQELHFGIKAELTADNLSKEVVLKNIQLNLNELLNRLKLQT